MYLVDGIFVLDVTHMVVLLFLVDFNTLALANDRVRERESFKRSSLKQPQEWDLNRTLFVGALLGLASVLEIVLFMKVLLPRIMPGNIDLIEFQTINLLMMFFYSSFTVLSVRERSWSYRSMATPVMLFAIVFNSIILTAACTLGFIPFLASVSPSLFGSIVAYVFLCFLSTHQLDTQPSTPCS